MTREDYLIRYNDYHRVSVEELLSASVETVQAWIDANLVPGQLLHVRRTSLDEFARDVTSEFSEPRPPYDDDAPESYPDIVKIMRHAGAIDRA